MMPINLPMKKNPYLEAAIVYYMITLMVFGTFAE